MGRAKKYETQTEAKDAQKKRIRESNDKTKTREKLFTKCATSQQKELIKTIKTVYIPMAKCEEMIQDILHDKSVKMMTDIMIEKGGPLIPESALPNDENTPLSDEPTNTPLSPPILPTDIPSDETNIITPKAKKAKAKPARKSSLDCEMLLEGIEKLFQKYLLPFEDIQDF
jgi:hypothetical protein